MDVPKLLAEAAVRLASDVKADAILALTDTGENCGPLTKGKVVDECGKEIKVVIATPNHEIYRKLTQSSFIKPIKLTALPHGGENKAHHIMACGLREGVLRRGERLVFLMGDGFADVADSITVIDVAEEELTLGTLESDLVLAAAVELAIELGRAGQEGKPVGAAFLVGDSKKVLRLSHQLMINPFESYKVNVTDRRNWDLIKKYATFDGAFLVDNEGTVVAAHRYLNVHARVRIPRGLGTRHHAVAAMTSVTNAKGVTVSGEDGMVRIFESGKLVAKVNPCGKIIEWLANLSKVK